MISHQLAKFGSHRQWVSGDKMLYDYIHSYYGNGDIIFFMIIYKIKHLPRKLHDPLITWSCKIG